MSQDITINKDKGNTANCHWKAVRNWMFSKMRKFCTIDKCTELLLCSNNFYIVMKNAIFKSHTEFCLNWKKTFQL